MQFNGSPQLTGGIYVLRNHINCSYMRPVYRTFIAIFLFFAFTNNANSVEMFYGQYYWFAASGVGSCTGTKATCAAPTIAGACQKMSASWTAGTQSGSYASCLNSTGGIANAGVNRYSNPCYSSGRAIDLSIASNSCYNSCPSGQTNTGGVAPGSCTSSCTGGTVWSETNQQCVPECLSPEVLNPQTLLCQPDCLDGQAFSTEYNECVPVCQEGSVLTTITVGANNVHNCTQPLPESEQCSDIAGYATDINGVEHQICNDQRAECESTGGTFGYINNEEVCLTDDYGDELPTCASNGVLIVNEFGYVCETPAPKDDPNNPDVPGSDDPDKDTDGDGTPDKNDSDIDGDGTPNGTDTDKDGDGVLDVDDPTPEGEEDKSEVGGGGSCESRPTCKGDAIQCAILYQTWATRCETESSEIANDGQCNTEPTCSGPTWQCATELQNWRAKCDALLSDQQSDTSSQQLAQFGTDNTVSALDKPALDITELSGDIFGNPTVAGSCPPPETLSVLGSTFNFSYQATCDVAADIRPFVLMFASLVAMRALWGAL